MSKKNKLIKKLKSQPKDFEFKDAETLLSFLGLEKDNKGKTSGSRIRFFKDGLKINLHKPHPGKVLPLYQVIKLIKILEGEGLI